MSFAEGRAFYEPIFARYAAMHNSIASGSLDGSRVISVQPVAQLTNRMRVILGALLVGIITDRVLLVQGFGAEFNAGLMDLFAPILSVERGVPEGSVVSLSIEDWESMYCGGGSGEVLDNPAVSLVVDGLHFFIADLYAQSSFRAAYNDVFGRWDGRIFAHAYAYFFPPAPAIARDVANYRSAVFGGHFMVGLHIRSGGDFQDPMTDADWSAFRTCAEALVPPERRNDVRYFAAVDTQAARTRTAALFANSSADVLFFKDYLVSNTVVGVQRALTDQLLVASCDLLVVTPASSYSEAATLLAEGRPAYYANLSHAQWWYGPAPPSRWAGGACRMPLYAQLENQNVMRHLPAVSCAASMDALALAELLG
jgi:hypothetical protein